MGPIGYGLESETFDSYPSLPLGGGTMQFGPVPPQIRIGTEKYQSFGLVQFRLNLLLNPYDLIYADSSSVYAGLRFRVLDQNENTNFLVSQVCAPTLIMGT